MQKTSEILRINTSGVDAWHEKKSYTIIGLLLKLKREQEDNVMVMELPSQLPEWEISGLKIF